MMAWRARVACVAATVGALSAPMASARADEGGLFGIGGMAAGVSGMFGDRLGGGGYGLSAHFELGLPVSPTALGNSLGFELATELGYESYAASELIFDVGLGFPITLLQLGEGGFGSTLLTFALGAGLNVQHAYGYVRGRLLFSVTSDLHLEAMGRWTPQEASTAWVDGEAGLDALQLRGSVFHRLDEDMGLQIFAEWSPADIAYATAEDPDNLARFPEPEVSVYQDVFRIGLGLVF